MIMQLFQSVWNKYRGKKVSKELQQIEILEVA